MAATAPRTSAALLLRPAAAPGADWLGAAAPAEDEEEPPVEDGELLPDALLLPLRVLLSVGRETVVLLREDDEPVTLALPELAVAVALLSLELSDDTTLETLDDTDEAADEAAEEADETAEDAAEEADAEAEPPAMLPTGQ